MHPPKSPPFFNKPLEGDTWTGNFDIKTHQFGEGSCGKENQHEPEVLLIENHQEHKHHFDPGYCDTNTGHTGNPEEEADEDVRDDFYGNDNAPLSLHPEG